jgi:hypothetical protein
VLRKNERHHRIVDLGYAIAAWSFFGISVWGFLAWPEGTSLQPLLLVMVGLALSGITVASVAEEFVKQREQGVGVDDGFAKPEPEERITAERP